MNEILDGSERQIAAGERDTGEAIKAHDANDVSQTFVADLDARMAKSELEELGWRNREDLDDVMRDLEILAAKNWQLAADLWDKYRPGEIDKPVFIDGNDIDEKKAERGASSPEPEPDQEKARDTDRSDEKESEALAMLRKRYLQAENKYYFRDDENKLAFEDKGKRLATEHNDPEIVRSMIELAESKKWNSIKLKGTDEFKREAWLQASLKGMQIQGFKPLDVDLAKLADYRKENDRTAGKGQNTIEQGYAQTRNADPIEKAAVVNEHDRTLSVQQRTAVEALKTILRSRGDSEKAVAMAAELATERFQTNRVYVGKVLEHGAAPYENNKDNENSYFVKLQTESGEKLVWGVDLKRAMDEGQAKEGDDVALAYQGRQQVTIKVKDRDEQGNVIGMKEITTNRNAWDVRKLEEMQQEVKERMAEASRRADRQQPLIKVYDRDAPRTVVHPVEIIPEKVRDSERTRG